MALNLGFIFAVIGGIIGIVVGGIAEAALWSAGDLTIETISNCEDLTSGWDKYVNRINLLTI